MNLPTHLTLNRGLVAHYATGAAVALSGLTEPERAAILAEIVARYNGHEALAERADAARYTLEPV